MLPLSPDREPRQGASSPLVRRYNEGLVLEAVRLAPGASRVDVATGTGLTTATVSTIVRGLLDRGVVLEDGIVPSRGGKPRTRLVVNPEACYAAGVRLDPEELLVVLASLDGHVVRSRHQRVLSMRPGRIVAQVADVVRRLISESGVAEDRIYGLGIATPGPVDGRRGVVLDPPNLRAWRDVPLKDQVQERLPFPVLLENDANAAAVGEKWTGSARGLANFIYVYLGAGVGGGIFLNHQLYRGSSGNAGAIGHLPCRSPSSDLCACGRSGCLETRCSQAALVSAGARLPRKVRDQLGLRLLPDTLDDDHLLLVEAAADGHPDARRIVADAAACLGDALVTTTNLLDISHVILGGRAVHRVASIYLQAIRASLQSGPIAHRAQHPVVLSSSLGDTAEALGAASLVFHEIYAPRLEVTE